MKIRKAFQGTVPENKILDTYSESKTDVYSCNQVNKLTSYSYEEQVIGKWVNGKPLYRKTINIGGLPNKSQKTTNHNIENISTVVRVYGYATNYTNYLPMPYASPDTLGNAILIYATKTQVIVQTGVDRTAYAQAEITIEYVKSTDTAS